LFAPGGTNPLCAFLNFNESTQEQSGGSRVYESVGGEGCIAVLNRAYLVRQIRTLLKFAKSTSDPRFATFLMDKAVHLKSQVEEVAPESDRSLLAPDVEPEAPQPKLPPA
jgi:hypothetical protein